MATPSPLDLRAHALFLDFDGTLSEFRDAAAAVGLDPAELGVLTGLYQAMSGALAVVSGRRIADLDCFDEREALRGAVNLLQIAPLSRAELDAYADLRAELEGVAGRLDGRFATLDWTPVQIMTTGFTPAARSPASIARRASAS